MSGLLWNTAALSTESSQPPYGPAPAPLDGPELPSFRYSLGAQKTEQFNGGTAKEANVTGFPVSEKLAGVYMPYSSDRELPDSVKRALPSHAQDIYREAFDNAWQEYSDPSKRRGNESLEEVAHKVAWAAVKKQYEKVGNEWQPKD